MSARLTIPGGREKDTPIDSASSESLEFWIGKKRQNLDRDPNHQWAANDRTWVAAAEAELARRQGGGAPAQSQQRQRRNTPPAQGQARQDTRLARHDVAAVAGSFANGDEATHALAEHYQTCHLVSPSTSCPQLPDGCVCAVSAVFVDPVRDTYKVGWDPKTKEDQLGLGKNALDKIAAAAGVSWDPDASGRLDDGSNPHYCHYRAVGRYRSFDGQWITITGEVEIDLREGSPQVNEIRAKARESDNEKRRAEEGASQILEYRKFMIRHAESKAKLRAIRSLGIRTSYARSELQRPFAVARLQFTGRSSNPETQKVYSEAIAASFLGSAPALYGKGSRQGGSGSGSAAPAMAAAPAPVGHPPPPVDRRETITADGEVLDGDFEPADDYGIGPGDVDDYDRGDDPNAY